MHTLQLIYLDSVLLHPLTNVDRVNLYNVLQIKTDINAVKNILQ